MGWFWPVSRITEVERTWLATRRRSGGFFGGRETMVTAGTRVPGRANVIGTYLHGPLLPEEQLVL